MGKNNPGIKAKREKRWKTREVQRTSLVPEYRQQNDWSRGGNIRTTLPPSFPVYFVQNLNFLL